MKGSLPMRAEIAVSIVFVVSLALTGALLHQQNAHRFGNGWSSMGVLR